MGRNGFEPPGQVPQPAADVQDMLEPFSRVFEQFLDGAVPQNFRRAAGVIPRIRVFFIERLVIIHPRVFQVRRARALQLALQAWKAYLCRGLAELPHAGG